LNPTATSGDDREFQQLARARRNDLAAALRLATRFELHEGIDNHFSYMLEDGTFLVNRWGIHWSRITAADILRVDLEGRILEGQGTVERTALVIHSEIHHSCPDAKAVLHTHMPFVTENLGNTMAILNAFKTACANFVVPTRPRTVGLRARVQF
jgi:ribulose-5-phosphate 4-epimerase/fuculose-1-phosphate aldolase